MNLESLLKALWPYLKPQLAAVLAKLLREKIPAISEPDALKLAVLLLGFVESLWLDPPDPSLVAQAQAQLHATA